MSGPALVRRARSAVLVAESVGARAAGVNLLAALSGLLAAAGAGTGVVLAVALVTVALILVLNWDDVAELMRGVRPTGRNLVSRTVLVVVAGFLVARQDEVGALAWASLALVALATVAESVVATLATRGWVRVVNLPGYAPRQDPRVPVGLVGALDLVAMVLALLGATGLPLGLAGVVALVALGLEVVVLLEALERYRVYRASPAAVRKALEQHAPRFVLHWHAPAGTTYQVQMWLPYLQRLGVPFYVLVRTNANFDELRGVVDVPVVLRASLEELDEVVVPSLRAVFYVNTATRNCHLIRYTDLWHVQLNHGDSDKAPSHNPVFRMFDRNFVAGQAAIDRFAANGVSMPQEMFRIVGRPQVEDVAVATAPISSVAAPSVLYAPTWAGFYDDTNYSSLRCGPQIVRALLARGCTVVFRPHPYVSRSAALARARDEIVAMLEADAAASGRRHLFGAVAERQMSVVDCFNAADALISDVSSVVNDFLFSGKPLAMVAVTRAPDRFADDFPVAAAAYVVDGRDGKAKDLDRVLDAMLGDDPLRERRTALRTYYLGDIPNEHYADRFVSEARRCLEPRQSR